MSQNQSRQEQSPSGRKRKLYQHGSGNALLVRPTSAPIRVTNPTTGQQTDMQPKGIQLRFKPSVLEVETALQYEDGKKAVDGEGKNIMARKPVACGILHFDEEIDLLNDSGEHISEEDRERAWKRFTKPKHGFGRDYGTREDLTNGKLQRRPVGKKQTGSIQITA